MNILICTPGRLLQHMEESPGFSPDNLKVFVIDEVDLLLEMGFLRPLKVILKNIRHPHQTLIFSATLNKNTHHLSSLHLNKPERIFLNELKLVSETDETGKPKTIKVQKITELPTNLT